MKKKVTNKMEWYSGFFWNIVKGMAAILALAGAFYAIDSRFATSEDLKNQKQDTIKTFEMFQNKMESRFLLGRLDTLRDQQRQLKIMLKKTPDDTDLQDKYNEVGVEIGLVRQKLDELDKK
jgi:hypothetical protein